MAHATRHHQHMASHSCTHASKSDYWARPKGWRAHYDRIMSHHDEYERATHPNRTKSQLLCFSDSRRSTRAFADTPVDKARRDRGHVGIRWRRRDRGRRVASDSTIWDGMGLAHAAHARLPSASRASTPGGEDPTADSRRCTIRVQHLTFNLCEAHPNFNEAHRFSMREVE